MVDAFTVDLLLLAGSLIALMSWRLHRPVLIRSIRLGMALPGLYGRLWEARRSCLNNVWSNSSSFQSLGI
jgi:hypothetical protein